MPWCSEYHSDFVLEVSCLNLVPYMRHYLKSFRALGSTSMRPADITTASFIHLLLAFRAASCIRWSERQWTMTNASGWCVPHPVQCWRHASLSAGSSTKNKRLYEVTLLWLLRSDFPYPPHFIFISSSLTMDLIRIIRRTSDWIYISPLKEWNNVILWLPYNQRHHNGKFNAS